MMKKVSFYLLGYFFTLMMVSSCDYDIIIPEPVIIPVDSSISFKDKIEPIFTDEGCIACHPPTMSLDLTVGKAYNSINKAKYIDTANDANSLIYTHPNPSTSEHSYKKYTPTQAATLLEWIKQGAKNN